MEAYWAAQPSDLPAMTLLVKTAGAPDSMAPKIKSMAESLDPKVFASVWLLKSGFHETARDLEKVAASVSLLGMLSLVIAGTGIVGLMAYTVSQQRKEIAIRIALGARQGQVLAAVLRQFLWPLILGLLAGAGITAAVSKILRKAPIRREQFRPDELCCRDFHSDPGSRALRRCCRRDACRN